MTATKRTEKCESLCAGVYQHGLALARQHEANVETSERYHREVHRLVKELQGLPDGSASKEVGAAEEKLMRLRGMGDLAAIRAVATEIGVLRARATMHRSEQERIQGEINAATLAAHRAVAEVLVRSFDSVVAKVHALTSDPALQAAPELLQLRDVETLWRAAGKIVEAFGMVAPAFSFPGPGRLMEAVPEPLRDYVAAGVGLPILPLRISLERGA